MFKKNDRVFDEYLGFATVIMVISEDMLLIETDVKPPIRYNGGDTKCIRFSKHLTSAENACRGVNQ
jgi:hypothetical protein